MKKEKILPVSEVFYSIQGEGQTMGVLAVFLRLGGCNLLCESKNWVCDTLEVWRKSKATEFKDILNEEMIDAIISKKAHLVFTGGEPLLHQAQIIEYLNWFEKVYQFLPTIEIETNGTINPDLYFINYHDIYFNISPKLSTAGEQNHRNVRINPDVLIGLSFASHNVKPIFKFVISCAEDIKELEDDFLQYLDKRKVVLMPAGSSVDELHETRQMVIDLCKTKGFRFSDRLHIVAWNKKTGV
jgi:7-carboxy-7-deazaguanine synthase